MKTTEVVAAFWERNGSFLIGQRPAHKARGLLWEFVGGKVEDGETPQQALIRECREELGVSPCVGELFCSVTHRYPDLTVHLSLYFISLPEGEPQPLEHNELRWITPQEIPLYAFCPADEPILRRIECRDIRRQLDERIDPTYAAFQRRLMPDVAPERVMGVRQPDIRALARRLSGTPAAGAFLADLPHQTYEENNLHAALIDQMRDFDSCFAALEAFLPEIDNWATCDMLAARALSKRPAFLHEQALRWMTDERPYTVRYGIGTLLRYFLDERFSPRDLEAVAAVAREEYYIRMMQAWYFATALAKQWEATFPYLKEKRLSEWVHRKTIRKAIESYRITPEQKIILRSLS